MDESVAGHPAGREALATAPMPAAALDCLRVPAERLGEGSGVRVEILPDAETLTRHFAHELLDQYRAAKAAGRERVVFIVPVGPIGQFELLAQRCNAERRSLADLVLVNMDEYLTREGRFIAEEDALSFRGHMRRALWDRLDPALAPPPAHRHFPDPSDPAATTRLIERLGGVDVAFGGVGITGHLAFNDPPEPGEEVSDAQFAARPTRVVRLSRETLTINAVTASRGNIDRIPRTAVTVGMKEILEARRIRLYLNRAWQCAIVRKLLHGPVSAAVPASLVRRHPDVAVTLTAEVAQLPEPTLR